MDACIFTQPLQLLKDGLLAMGDMYFLLLVIIGIFPLVMIVIACIHWRRGGSGVWSGGSRPVSQFDQPQEEESQTFRIIRIVQYYGARGRESDMDMERERMAFWLLEAVLGKVPIDQAARFVPTSLLQEVMKYLVQLDERITKVEKLTESIHLVLDVLRNVLSTRTLQDHCVLTILQAVRGDARKVQGLSELPEPAKELFLVPPPQTSN